MNSYRLLLRAVAVIVGLMLIQSLAGGLLETVNRGLYDAALRWQSLRQPSERVPYVLVEIDDASVEALGRFPWSRDLFAQVLERTTEGRARVVGIDVIFAEAADPEGDRAFAASISRAGNVVLASAAALARPQELEEGTEVFGQLRVAERLLEPLPLLSGAAAGVGSVSVLEDSDGSMRRYPVVVSYQGAPYQSLAQVMASLSEADGAVSIPLERDGSILINYGSLSPASIARISFADVLELDRAGALRLFSDKIVLVAATYTGGVDVAPTPLATRTPASYTHIYSLHTLLTGRSLTPLSALISFLFALLVVAVLSSQITEGDPKRTLTMAAITVTVVVAGSAAFFLIGRIALEPSLASLAALVFVAGHGVEQWWTNVNARRRAEAFLERFMGARIRRRGLDESALDVHAQNVDLTILSLRLVGFSDATREMKPQAVVDLVRSLHHDMVGAVEAEGGVVDRLLGDGLVAYWGYPEAHADSPSRAVEASQNARRLVMSASDRLANTLGSRIRLRLGIATGSTIIADLGTEAIADFTILGPSVALADRLRDEAPVDGVHICERTYAGARSALPGSVYEQSPLEVEGLDGPISTYLLERPFRAWVDRNLRDRSETD